MDKGGVRLENGATSEWHVLHAVGTRHCSTCTYAIVSLKLALPTADLKILMNVCMNNCISETIRARATKVRESKSN